MPGLLQKSAIMAFHCSLSPVLLMSSLLGDSVLVMLLFRLSVYFGQCIPLLLVPQIYPPNICFSNPSALFICPKTCSCHFPIKSVKKKCKPLFWYFILLSLYISNWTEHLLFYFPYEFLMMLLSFSSRSASKVIKNDPILLGSR